MSDPIPLQDIKSDGGVDPSMMPGNAYMFDVNDLSSLSSNRDIEQFRRMGGVEGISIGVISNPRTGLGEEEEDSNFQLRAETFGRNEFPEPPHTSFFKLLWDAVYEDLTMKILVVAGLISLILGVVPGIYPADEPGPHYVEGLAILLAVLIVSFVTAINDYSKDKQFRNLNKVKQDRDVTVIRHEEKMQINIHDLMVGDLAVLETGDQIPADGVFAFGFGLECDESVMTGESDNVKKTEDKPFMLSGCLVTDGSGTMIVTAVGVNSVWGQMMATFQGEDHPTPLQEKLDKMALLIGKFGLGTAILTFIVLMIRWAITMVIKGHVGGEDWVKILDFFIIAVTIVVVAVPEGLPLAVTISLAYSMQKMLEDKNLVRHLDACETMGGATQICSDKTGTLTLNQMTVTQAWLAGERYTTIPEAQEINSEVLGLLTELIALNSKAWLRVVEGGRFEMIGSKTECALLLMSRKFGVDYEKIRNAIPIQYLYAFNSALKRMSVVIDKNSTTHRIYCKGASEIVLEKCTQVMTNSGEVVALDDAKREEIKESIESMASNALRTLCLAYADFPKKDAAEMEEAPDHDLICIGVVGISDPVRPEVPGAVLTCQNAGIMVRMVTGDYPSTARAIAKECGILTTGIVVEGPKWRVMSDAQKDAILPRLQVMARSSPTDKFDLVVRLKKHREVVAVTGDGTNDAPALREADVGLSMGIAGTEVAKEASDVVILDDNFSSIVKAVMWGRSVFDNIRRFLQFQLTVNVVALAVAFVGGVGLGDSPLTALQLLWVNLIMDSMGALALGTEPPTSDLLQRKPHGRHTPLLSAHMIRHIVGMSIYQLIVLFIMLFGGCFLFIDLYGIPRTYTDTLGKLHHNCDERGSIHFTVIFNAFVFAQIFNEFNARKIYNEMNIFAGLTKCKMFIFIIVITIVLQVPMVQFFGAFMNTTALDWYHWLPCIIIGLLALPVGMLSRLIPVSWFERPKPRTMWTQTEDSALNPSGSAGGMAGCGVAMVLHDDENESDSDSDSDSTSNENENENKEKDSLANASDVVLDVKGKDEAGENGEIV